MYQTIAGQRFEKPEPWKSDMLNVLGDLYYQRSKGAMVQDEIDVVIENAALSFFDLNYLPHPLDLLPGFMFKTNYVSYFLDLLPGFMFKTNYLSHPLD